MLMHIIGAVALAVAPAHHAPSGAVYSIECCSNKDCHMIESPAVRDVPGGYMVMTWEGEVFFPSAKLKKPIDQDWHECHNRLIGPELIKPINPICLIPPFKGF